MERDDNDLGRYLLEPSDQLFRSYRVGQDFDASALYVIPKDSFQDGAHIEFLRIAGSLSTDVDMVYAHGIDAVFGVVPHPCSLEDALANAAANIRLTARNIAATIRLSRKIIGE